MALPREEVVQGTAEGLAQFEELLRSLDDEAWQKPTRCEGWTVADVAAHVVGTMTMITNGQLQELTDPDHVNRQTAERKGRTPAQLADELRDAAKLGNDLVGSFDDAAWGGPPPLEIPGTLGQAVEAIWYDTYVHTEDINAATGRAPERGPGLKVAVSHVTDVLDQQGWGPATFAFDGLPEIAIGGGGGKRVTGDPLTFVLVATGREDPSVLGLDETVNIYRPQP
ncbi:MAG: hypothetical protein QOI20_1731 [Acidimicrobiaceae bacterium]|nr:hypothetical protein [Acidimicrobiaceae bacterium]